MTSSLAEPAQKRKRHNSSDVDDETRREKKAKSSRQSSEIPDSYEDYQHTPRPVVEIAANHDLDPSEYQEVVLLSQTTVSASQLHASESLSPNADLSQLGTHPPLTSSSPNAIVSSEIRPIGADDTQSQDTGHSTGTSTTKSEFLLSDNDPSSTRAVENQQTQERAHDLMEQVDSSISAPAASSQFIHYQQSVNATDIEVVSENRDAGDETVNAARHFPDLASQVQDSMELATQVQGPPADDSILTVTSSNDTADGHVM